MLYILLVLFLNFRIIQPHRFFGSSNPELICRLRKHEIIKHDDIEVIMNLVNRENYVQNEPFQDSAQSIGYGATISAPHMHAWVLEMLRDHLKKGASVLDVGCGSGYLTACMALMVGRAGRTVGIDDIDSLIDIAKTNIMKDNPGLLKTGKIKLIVGDGQLGYPPDSPYDVINVGAAVKTLPQALVDQLKPGGRLVIAIGQPYVAQILETVDKHLNGTVTREEVMSVYFDQIRDYSEESNNTESTSSNAFYCPKITDDQVFTESNEFDYR